MPADPLVARDDHFGLRLAVTRVRQAGGTLQVTVPTTGGTTVTVRLPTYAHERPLAAAPGDTDHDSDRARRQGAGRRAHAPHPGRRRGGVRRAGRPSRPVRLPPRTESPAVARERRNIVQEAFLSAWRSRANYSPRRDTVRLAAERRAPPRHRRAPCRGPGHHAPGPRRRPRRHLLAPGAGMDAHMTTRESAAGLHRLPPPMRGSSCSASTASSQPPRRPPR